MYVGNEARFICPYISNAIWTFNKYSLPHNTKTGEINGILYLEIYNASYSNAGTYTCSGYKDGGYNEAVGKLEVRCKLKEL